jgi:aminoglycoside N3'-acetyltransferase
MAVQWWEVLGVPREAPLSEIQARHRVLTMIYHPDRFTGAPNAVLTEATRRMGEANEAFRQAKSFRRIKCPSCTTLGLYEVDAGEELACASCGQRFRFTPRR